MPHEQLHEMYTDPVCGQTVRDAGAPTAVHYNTRFHFCSAACRRRFIDDPDTYAVEVNSQPWFYSAANRRDN